MTDPIEVELKLELDPDDRDRIAAALGPGESAGTAHLVSTYFDSPRHAVHRAGYSLRVRRDGGTRIQTIKADGHPAAGLFARAEWEREIDRDVPVIEARDGPLARTLAPATIERLAPVFVTDVERTTLIVERDGTRFLCTIDDGEIRAGARSARLCEIELELASGAPGPLFDVARRLNEIAPLRLAVQSKALRGYELAGGDPPHAIRAAPIELARTVDIGEAFRTIARSCLQHFRRNEALLDRHGGEALHQARVALRRLRTAFSCCAPLFAGDERAELLEAEIRWLAAELGEFRNLDVLIAAGLPPVAQNRLVAARARAFAHVRADLASGRTRLLMIDLAEWLEGGDWRMRPVDPDLLHRNVVSFANDLLDAQRRQLVRRGKGLAGLGDRRRHKVRIAAKKLRYAGDFFASLYPSPKARRRHERFLAPLQTMQDNLGRLNDLVVGSQTLARLGIDATLPHAGKRARAALAHRAAAAYDTLTGARRFWD